MERQVYHSISKNNLSRIFVILNFPSLETFVLSLLASQSKMISSDQSNNLATATLASNQAHIPFELPKWTSEEVQKQLEENASFLEEWTKLLDKHGKFDAQFYFPNGH